MNWARILTATVFAIWLILVGGLVWLRSHLSSTASRFPSRSTIVLNFEKPAHMHAHDPDLHTTAMVLRSQMLHRRVVASLSPDELSDLVGAEFWKTGRTPWRGLRIKIDRERSSVVIVTSHSNPLIAQRIGRQLCIEYARIYKDADREAVQELYERRIKLVARANETESNANGIRDSNDAAALSRAEEEVLSARKSVRIIEDRIAEVNVQMKKPANLPFRVTDARVVSGPPWNRRSSTSQPTSRT